MKRALAWMCFICTRHSHLPRPSLRRRSPVSSENVWRRAAGCHRGSREPGNHRKGPDRRDRRGSGPVPDHRAPARRLHRDLHAARLQHRQARRHQPDRRVHRIRRRRAAGRRARGDDHRHRRSADRGRAEHHAAARDRRRRHQQPADRPQHVRAGHPRSGRVDGLAGRHAGQPQRRRRGRAGNAGAGRRTAAGPRTSAS